MGQTGSTRTDWPNSGYLVERFRLESNGRLYLGANAVELTDAELKVLGELVAHSGQVVTHAQLRQAMTGSVDFPCEDAQQIVTSIEKRLGIGKCIKSVYKRGYRFVGDVKKYGSNTLSMPSLAILPVDAGVDVPEYLAEALTEETGRRLKTSGRDAVEVLEQDSVSTLAARSMGPVQIGSTLHADLVLQSTLQELPGQLRLRAEMRSGSDGSPLWSEDLVLAERRVDTLAGELANRISVRLGGATALAATADARELSYTQEAYELLWRARSGWKTLQRHQMQDALQQLRRTVELAPHWVEARVALANLCVQQAIYGFMPPLVAAQTIKRAAGGPMDSCSDALLPSLGWVHLNVDRDLAAAQAAFHHSAHLPHDRWTTWTRAMFALGLHRFNQALDMLEKGIELDPYSGGLHARRAWTLHLAGRAKESVERIECALKEFPEHELTLLYAVMILAYNGEAERAIEIAEGLIKRCPYFDPALSAHAYALACAERRESALGLLEQVDWLSRERFVLRAFLPAVYVVLGDYDAAVEELRQCDRLRCPWFLEMLADPRLKPIADREDFKELAAVFPQMKTAVTARVAE